MSRLPSYILKTGRGHPFSSYKEANDVISGAHHLRHYVTPGISLSIYMANFSVIRADRRFEENKFTPFA